MMVYTCGEFLAGRHNKMKEIIIVQPEGKLVDFILYYFIFYCGPNSPWNCDCFRWKQILHSLSTFNPIAALCGKGKKMCVCVVCE